MWNSDGTFGYCSVPIAAIEKAVALKDHVSAREQLYIDAAGARNRAIQGADRCCTAASGNCCADPLPINPDDRQARIFLADWELASTTGAASAGWRDRLSGVAQVHRTH